MFSDDRIPFCSFIALFLAMGSLVNLSTVTSAVVKDEPRIRTNKIIVIFDFMLSPVGI
jgi:hypothetical protein